MYKKTFLTLSISLLILFLTPALIAETADIHEAAANEDIELIQEILADGVDPDLEDEEDRTPAMLAARENSSTSILEALYEAGADLDARDEIGKAVIHYAASNSEAEIIEFLIENDVQLKESNGDSGAVQELVEDEKEQDIKDERGMTPLLLAARDNTNTQVLDTLLEAGADLDAREKINATVFHYAAINPEPEIIKFLIENDARLDGKNERGQDPLLYAIAENPNPEVIDILLDLDVEYDFDLALRASVTHREDTSIFEKLIDYGVDITQKDSHKSVTILNNAVRVDNPEFLNILIEEGADLTERCNRGITLLMYASMDSSNPEILEILKDHGAEVDAQSINNKTALIFATEFNNSEEIIHTLLDFGADPTMQDRDGMMALDYAEKNPDLAETEAYERLLEETEAAKN